jgi:hypothetical protein
LFLTEPVGGSAQFASSRAWIAGNANPPIRIGKYTTQMLTRVYMSKWNKQDLSMLLAARYKVILWL